jgi:hypothetical protein
VLDKELKEKKAAIENLVEQSKLLQKNIEDERVELARMTKEQKSKQPKKDPAQVDHGNHVTQLQDTVVQLEREIQDIDLDIELYKKNIYSCQQQQEHTKMQLDDLIAKNANLGSAADKKSIDVLNQKKGSTERKKLENEEAEIQEFMEANLNTKLTLLDHRANTDKSKQRLQRMLQERILTKAKKEKRLNMVRELAKTARNAEGASDGLVRVLEHQKKKLTDHFDLQLPKDKEQFIEARTEQESDEAFLEDLQRETEELLSLEDPRRIASIRPLLRDQLQLCRTKSDMLADAWIQEDLNFATFFAGARQPKVRRSNGPSSELDIEDSL